MYRRAWYFMAEQHDWRSQAKCAEVAPAYDNQDAEDPTERSILYFFFEGYEKSEDVRKVTDTLCSMCPVSAECLADGLENNETGVRAGVYLSRGHIDENKNAGKSKEEWQRIRGLVDAV